MQGITRHVSIVFSSYCLGSRGKSEAGRKEIVMEAIFTHIRTFEFYGIDDEMRKRILSD